MSKRAAVLAALQSADRPLLTSEVATAAGLFPKEVWGALSELLRDGLIQRSKAGGRSSTAGGKERKWRITPKTVQRSAA